MSQLTDTLMTIIRDHVKTMEQRTRPRRAWVGDETDGQVTLAYTNGGAAGEQRHARLAGTPFSPGDEVLILPLGSGQYVVLGAIQQPE